MLEALQASQGLISSEVRGVSVQIEADRVVLHFALWRLTGEVEEDISDMVFELDALRGGHTAVETVIHVGPTDDSWPGRGGRLIYLAKDPAPGW
ncbi:hypothetical protein JJ691_64180 [Kutzneria sp. CA-103260]|nr:hypothetical protein JJ691_64180 [Kutzneria sp. CA-103260]